NGNGVVDAGDGFLSGWTVYWDSNGNSQYDAGEPSTVTDSNGAYSLGVPEHLYVSAALTSNFVPVPLREVLQAGWIQTGLQPFHPASLFFVDFLNFKLISISGTVWDDVNMNGVHDLGETGVPNINLALVRSGPSGGGSLAATTNANGNYVFTGLGPGLY